MIFWSWDDYPFDAKQLQNIWNAEAVPMITLEPWHAKSKKAISLKSLTSGKEDKVLVQFGETIKNFKHPLFIRFAHEMNGNWYPWSGEKNGRSSEDYINAYKHVHDIVNKAAGDTPLIWIWSINWEDVPKEDWNKASNYYPGNKYVDAVGLDGYNWGNTKKWGHQRSFEDIFNKEYLMATKLYPSKPIFITETATVSSNGDRAAWIKDMFSQLNSKYNLIPLFVWFDIKKEADWRVSADKARLREFKIGLNAGFRGRRDKLLKSFIENKLER